jgi:DNA-binding CsgD family transcriptional regulator
LVPGGGWRAGFLVPASCHSRAATTSCSARRKRFVDEVRDFLAHDVGRGEGGRDLARAGLSARELEILRFAAQGRTNFEIGDALGLSVRTVERHLSNAYNKLGVTGKAARAAAVARVVAHGASLGSDQA